MATQKKKKKKKKKKSSTSIAALIEALPEDLRDLVVERASIIFESGVLWDEAERLAYEQETGRARREEAAGADARAIPESALPERPGIARATVRDDDEEAVDEPAPKTTRSSR